MRGSIERLKNIFLVVLDFVLLKEAEVLLAKRAPGMMPLLISYVVDDSGEL